MSLFCFDCVEQTTSGETIVSIIIRGLTAVIATFALYVAYRNLRSVRNSHALQAQMSLITLEKDVRKNRSQFREDSSAFSKAMNKARKGGVPNEIYLAYSKSFEYYVSSADKLAAIILTGNLKIHFPTRNFRNEYEDIFMEVQKIYETSQIFSSNEKINNLIELLSKDEW